MAHAEPYCRCRPHEPSQIVCCYRCPNCGELRNDAPLDPVKERYREALENVMKWTRDPEHPGCVNAHDIARRALAGKKE